MRRESDVMFRGEQGKVHGFVAESGETVVRRSSVPKSEPVMVEPVKPGILPDPADNSCLPKAARAAGLSYDALIQRCLMHAADRTGVLLQGTPPHPHPHPRTAHAMALS